MIIRKLITTHMNNENFKALSTSFTCTVINLQNQISSPHINKKLLSSFHQHSQHLQKKLESFEYIYKI